MHVVAHATADRRTGLYVPGSRGRGSPGSAAGGRGIAVVPNNRYSGIDHAEEGVDAGIRVVVDGHGGDLEVHGELVNGAGGNVG